MAPAVLAGILATLWLPAAAFADPAQGVVKIQCKEASGKLSAGTGFAWPDSTHIATALHVVAGCQALTVMLGDTKWSASLEKVLVGSDLALLKLTSRPNTPPGSPASLLVPLASAPNIPDPELGHAIWGYPCCDNPKQAQKNPVTFGRKTESLGDFISLETYKNELHADPPAAQGSPASNTGILTIMSAIRQGHSGAPILERDVVVGVADGGLHQGLRSLNWAIPSSELSELRNSKEPVASYKKQRMSWPVLFSAEDHGEDLSIGLGHGDSLAYIWSAEVEEIVATTTHDERDDIDEEMTRYQRELSRVEGHAGEAAAEESAGADLSGLWHLKDQVATVQQEGTLLNVTFEGTGEVAEDGVAKAFVGAVRGLKVDLSELGLKGRLSEDHAVIAWSDGTKWTRSSLVGTLDVFQDQETTATVALPAGAVRALGDNGLLRVTFPGHADVAMYIMIAESGGEQAEKQFMKYMNELSSSAWLPRTDLDGDEFNQPGYREIDREWYAPSSVPDEPPSMAMFSSTKVFGSRFLGTAMIVNQAQLSERDLRPMYLLKLCSELSTFPEMDSR